LPTLDKIIFKSKKLKILPVLKTKRIEVGKQCTLEATLEVAYFRSLL
jgi:hypothetical protein